MHVAEYTGYRTLRFERRERVLRVTIDRAGVLNTINEEMHDDLSRVFEEINRDAGCDVVVLSLLRRRRHALVQPIICRLNGAAAGLGATLAPITAVSAAMMTTSGSSTTWSRSPRSTRRCRTRRWRTKAGCSALRR